MSFTHRFSETRFEQEGNRRLRLLGKAGELLLELRGAEIAAAVRAGFVDPDNYHFSMFEYARIRATLPSLAPVERRESPRADFDQHFLAGLKICWE